LNIFEKGLISCKEIKNLAIFTKIGKNCKKWSTWQERPENGQLSKKDKKMVNLTRKVRK